MGQVRFVFLIQRPARGLPNVNARTTPISISMQVLTPSPPQTNLSMGKGKAIRLRFGEITNMPRLKEKCDFFQFVFTRPASSFTPLHQTCLIPKQRRFGMSNRSTEDKHRCNHGAAPLGREANYFTALRFLIAAFKLVCNSPSTV